MSKMGISTVSSYCGAQVFEAVGLDHRLVERYFTGTPGKIGGIGLAEIHAEVAARHAARLPGQPGRAVAPAAGGRRRVPVAPRGRAAPVQPGDGVPAPARHPQPAVRRVPAVHRQGGRAGGRGRLAARPVPLAAGRARAGAARRGRAGQRDRQAVRHRRDVLRLDLGRGARDAGHRDEPARRQVQHRRGRRGRRPALRPGPPLGGQAGRQRPVRRDQRVPGQRRRHPDQDGAGRQARRGRPAARQQGVAVDRQDPARHARASG